MTKYFSLAALLALRIIVYPPQTNQHPDPFTSPATNHHALIQLPATLISFEGKINSSKVLLNWVVSENETADKFEIEKSFDGIHFQLAALVFGTDKPANGEYAFFEKAISKKVSYRIKLVSKNNATAYSSIIEINPHVG